MEQPDQPKRDGSKPAQPAAKKANAEVWAQRLRAEVRKRRPWTLSWAAILLIMTLGVLGLFLWWIWPGQPPLQLAVIAFDGLVGSDGRHGDVRAQFVVAEPHDDPVRLAGYEAFFLPGGGPAGVLLGPPVRAESDADGRLSVPWELDRATLVNLITIRHAIPRPRHSTEDTARLFVLPKGGRQIIVDTDALIAPKEPKWGSTPTGQIKTRGDAVTALAKLAKGNQVIYAVFDLERPEQFRAVRGWIQQTGSGTQSLPVSPVFCSFSFGPRTTPTQARTLLLKDLSVFQPDASQRTAFTANPVAASEYARSCRTYLIGGEGTAPAGVTRVAEWDRLE
jgi:hypothetical protein